MYYGKKSKPDGLKMSKRNKEHRYWRRNEKEARNDRHSVEYNPGRRGASPARLERD